MIHAVVIGMMFSNVNAEYTGMIGALESEASAMIRLYNEMERRDAEHFEPAMEALKGYLQFVVVEEWLALREADARPEQEEPEAVGSKAIVARLM